MKQLLRICVLLLSVLPAGSLTWDLSAQSHKEMSIEALIGTWIYQGVCTEGHKKSEKICKICSEALSASGFPEQETRLNLGEDGQFSFACGEKSIGGNWELDDAGQLCLRFRDAFVFSLAGSVRTEGEDGCKLLFPYGKFEGFLQRTQSIVGKTDTFLTIVALQTTVSDGGKVSVGFRLKRIR